MKDEIKEILDDLLFTTTLPNVSVKLSNEKLYQLKDYITNLHEELKSANESITWWSNRFKAVEKENKKLKETNVYCNRTDCIGRIKDSRKYDSVYQEKEDYKSRIDKASEYIKDSGITFLNLANQRCFCNNNCADKIINILNGGNE